MRIYSSSLTQVLLDLIGQHKLGTVFLHIYCTYFNIIIHSI